MGEQITVGEWTYSLEEDGRHRFDVALRGSLLDEMTGMALERTFTIEADRDDLLCKPIERGLYCVAADVPRAFPNLATTNATWQLTARAEGYRTISWPIVIPAGSLLPRTELPKSLRREPVRFAGRVTHATTGPFAAANIRTIGASDCDLLLRAPVAFDHTLVATVRESNLTAIAFAPAKKLKEPAFAASDRIVVENRLGLLAGQFVRLGAETSGEFAEIQTVSNVASAGEVVFTAELKQSFPAETDLAVFNAGAAGTSTTLRRSADKGDGALFLNAPLTGPVVEVVEAGLPTEYHAVGALTNSDGYYALNGITAIKELRVRVTPTAGPSKDFSRIVDYSQKVNTWDFRL